MDYIKILKRGWHILWSYKALWVFGIILALTTAGGGNGGGNNGARFSGGENNGSFIHPPANLVEQFDDLEKFLNNFVLQEGWRQYQNVLIGVGIALVCVGIVLAVFFAIARYVSEVSLIRMVDRYEEVGEKLTWKQGVRLGWSRSAWRLFLINLVIFVPVFLGIMLLFGCAALPVLLSVIAGNDPSIPGIVATIGLVFLAIFVLIVVGAVLAIVIQPIYRVCVLQDLGVFASIRQGFSLVRKNLMDIVLMWLILIGVRIGFFIVMIPVILLVLALALLLGGGLGVGMYFLINALAGSSAGLVTGILLGLFLFILVVAIPATFLQGLKETYLSSVWTLTYRELMAKMAAKIEAVVEPTPQAEPAS